jgi:ligand-binding sensor domain-containing protein
MKKTFLILSMSLIIITGYSQHLYKEKYEGCNTTRFCLDCGDIKAQFPKSIKEEFITKFDKKSLAKIKGTIEVQILIDENGKPCLLSSQNNATITSKELKLQEAINSTTYWEPAIANNNKENASVSLSLDFENGDFTIKRRVFDFGNQSNAGSVGEPEIKVNEKEKLTEKWTVYTQQNSELPWDMTRAVANDLDNNIWIGTDNGIVKIENNKWIHFNSENTIISSTAYNKNKTQAVSNMEVDRQNNKWFVIGWAVYKYDNEKWTKYDSINSPIRWTRKIFIDQNNNAWFTSWDGVTKFDGNNWTVFNKANSNLPTDKVLGIYVDRNDRIWIGTFEGNVRIENHNTTLLNDVNSPLSKACISKMYEDKNGNMWFSLYKDKSDDAGIYILNQTGKWLKISHPNSKMFSENAINDFYLDEDNNYLWVTLNGVGILKYDIMTEKWEVYTNQNSDVPSIHIERITKDKNGAIWAATYAGVIKQEK